MSVVKINNIYNIHKINCNLPYKSYFLLNARQTWFFFGWDIKKWSEMRSTQSAIFKNKHLKRSHWENEEWIFLPGGWTLSRVPIYPQCRRLFIAMTAWMSLLNAVKPHEHSRSWCGFSTHSAGDWMLCYPQHLLQTGVQYWATPGAQIYSPTWCSGQREINWCWVS